MVGVGVGLTLPTMMASATSELPPENFATGSAVVNMLRQVGLAIGVAVLVAVLGTHSGAHALLDAFDHAWLVIGAFAAADRARVAGDPRGTPPGIRLIAHGRDRPDRRTRCPRRGSLAHPQQQKSH